MNTADLRRSSRQEDKSEVIGITPIGRATIVKLKLNALEVYDRFGGSCMEEVLEKGSCVVELKEYE